MVRYHHLFYCNPENGQIISFENHPTQSNQPLRGMYSVMEDRSGNWWLGSMGFYKLSVPGQAGNNKPRFETYKWAPNDPKGLSSTDIRAVFEASPSVFWLATHGGGLNRLDRSTGAVQHWRHDPSVAQSLGSDRLYALWHNPLADELWIGHEKGVDILDLRQGGSGRSSALVFRHFRSPSGLLDDRINELRPDGKGNLWIGTSMHGLLLMDLETKEIRDSIIFDEANADPAHSAFINKVFIDSKGQTWAAPGMGGLCRLRETEDGFRYECFLDGLFIVDLFEASDGWLWCAAMNYGIIKFNPKDGSYEIINMENRLSRNSVMGIEADRLGRIWFTSVGLTRYDPEDDTYRSYGRESGVLGLNPERCFFKSSSGELFYSAANSALQIFTPEDVRDNPAPPQVVLTDFKLFNESVTVGAEGPLRESVEVASAIYLTHDQHSFSLEFVGLEYTDPLKNQYRYQLEGVDREWVYAGTNREARYNSVPPGKYIFRVAAANSDGVWSDKPASVQIVVASPWWQRWWAYLFFLGLLLTPLLLIYRYQMKRRIELAETRRIKEIDALKTRLYTNITHEFRTPLTVILGMAGQVIRQPERWFREGMDMIVRNADNLLELVNQMLDLRKIEAGEMKLNKQLGDIIPYLAYLAESFHSFAESRNIDLQFSASMEACEMDHDPDSLKKIMTNLLSNAIKYTSPGGQIAVSVDRMDGEGTQWLKIGVKDTGIGIPVEQQKEVFRRFHQAAVQRETTWMNIRPEGGTGVGLALTHELVRLLGGTINLQSEPGKGSTFAVQLPVTRSAPRGESFQKNKLNGVSSFRPTAGQEGPADRILSKEEGEDRPLALIIEDNKDVVRYLSSCLEQDYRLMAAYNGHSGIELAREHVPDIIISDVMMPEKDGFEVTSTLKNDERTSHIPIILLTARATHEDRLLGLERGADAYLAKPFDQDELTIHMEKMIELRNELRRRYAGANQEPVAEDANLKLEDDFVRKVRGVIERRRDDPDFGVQALSEAVFLSSTQLHRKLKALTGEPPGHFIRTVRLQHARHLLKTTEKSVTEISQEVGFRDLAYFSRVFTSEYGKPPSEMRE
jgi:signal transduction histidine kinase/CheY-like chemotaxis protein/sugar lactone lactonase YvrE